MRLVLQRVQRASVTVKGVIVGQIGAGLLALVGFAPDDGSEQIEWMADKVLGLRVFSDDEGKMNRSVRDVSGSVLVVSQFTLYGDARRGRRPSFVDAAAPAVARRLYDEFVAVLRKSGQSGQSGQSAVPETAVATGEFGADMQVELVNDGPVTLIIDSPGGTVDEAGAAR
jgi:D-tyrosyl-tRNA(Tyr) deacylase